MLLLVILLYSYFSRTSFHAIDSQMTNYNESQLAFLKYQIESNIERLSLTSSILVRDSSLLDLQISILTEDYYRMLDYRTHVKEKLNLQSLSSNWSNQLAVYLPTIRTRVSTDLSDSYDQRMLDMASNGTWTFHPGASPSAAYYQLFMWDPYLSKSDSNSDPDSVNAVFEVRFGLDNIRKMLQHYKLDSPGSSFLLTADGRAFSNAEASDGAFEAFGAELLKEGLDEGGHRNVSFQNQRIFFELYVPARFECLPDRLRSDRGVLRADRQEPRFVLCQHGRAGRPRPGGRVPALLERAQAGDDDDEGPEARRDGRLFVQNPQTVPQ
ncbi:hypothetical protein [Cohnella rhizosphaerae]|uniref:Uncharacterized protein n=1 Tax=Cohnella rhizosphaerae TaxID=1457232 RepID=A0A9X4KP59_9BACL|nr:hypothetical protein [Cohnella rhizosphaerae]MDG0808175.1 hypothetical protein [Cohnella rhizosphaerae]